MLDQRWRPDCCPLLGVLPLSVAAAHSCCGPRAERSISLLRLPPPLPPPLLLLLLARRTTNFDAVVMKLLPPPCNAKDAQPKAGGAQRER